MKIFKSQFPDPPQPEWPDLYSMLAEKVRRYGNKTALVCSTSNNSLSYTEVISLSERIGTNLYHEFNLRKGDVILLLIPNCIEYMLICFGALSIGAIVSSANPSCTVGEAVYHMNESASKYCFTTEAHALKFRSAVKQSVTVKGLFVIDKQEDGFSWNTILKECSHEFPRVEISRKSDVAVLPFSSGTTGKPKGVMLTHYNLQCQLLQSSMDGVRTFDTLTRMLLYLPLFHIYGFTQALSSFFFGGCTVLMAQFSLTSYIRNVTKYKPSYLPIVPPTLIQLVKDHRVNAVDFECVKMFSCGAAPVAREIEEKFSEKFKSQVKRQGYGLTETSAGLIKTPQAGLSKYGSSGNLMPGIEIRIVDISSCIDCDVNKSGEIWCRGAVVMKGYFNRPEETKKVLDDDGWLRTGDIGYIDEDGSVFVVDRLKELIKYKAYQVPPAELEDLILGHPTVADCAVIGVPHDEHGELPRAYVVLKEGANATCKEIEQYVARHVSSSKRLRGGVVFVDNIPKSSSGKILRRYLRNQLKEEYKSNL